MSTVNAVFDDGVYISVLFDAELVPNRVEHARRVVHEIEGLFGAH